MLTMRDTYTAFDTCHPAVPATYFAATILIAIFAMQPVCVGISLAGALMFSLAARGWRRTLGGLRWQLPMVALVAVANPLFSASGSTLVAQLGPMAIYQESIAYGACAGALLVTVVLWFEDAACVLTQDRLLQLGARALPTVTLLTSMAAQLVPQLMHRSQTVRAATLATTAAAPKGSRARGVRVADQLMSWSMEDSIERSDAMRARGWGATDRRSRYLPDSFRNSDAFALAGIVLLAAGSAFLVYVACSQWRFYPTMPRLVAWWGYVPYTALALLPTVLDLGQRVRWGRVA